MKKWIRLLAAYGIYTMLIMAMIFTAISMRTKQTQEKVDNYQVTNQPINNNQKQVTFSVDDILKQKMKLFFGETKPVSKKKIRKPIITREKYVILTFDDGWSSQYKAYQIIKPLKGTLYISSSLIGQKDRLTVEQLKEMYTSGWDISNHTVHHKNLLKVNLEQAIEEIGGCSSWIRGQGFTRNDCFRHFAYPEGGYNSEIVNLLQKMNIFTARTTEGGNNVNDFLKIGRTSFYGMTPKNIRDNIVSEKPIVILSFHRIVPDTTVKMTEIDLRESYFKEAIKAIYDSKRTVLTMTEWYRLNTVE